MDLEDREIEQVIIIGAGPAGLTAAYELCKAGVTPMVIEQASTVGGLAKTINHKGFRFDIGGHRFYTKVEAAANIWREVLPARDFLRRKRLSRIYYNKRFFQYPLRASSLLFNLGLWNGCHILLSYLWARMFPFESERTFEEWVTNRFGNRLYSIFFKPYTEKVWGIPCNEITSDWASQRIKGLSLAVALKNIFIPQKNEVTIVKTLINEFEYPRLGPGMMWETMAKLVQQHGGAIHLKTRVERIHWSGDTVEAVDVDIDGRKKVLRGKHFISSMPMRELVNKLSPAPGPSIREAANKLQYRDFLIVVIIINRPHVFPDNWIYLHDPGVRAGRIQNFKNWSPDMVPDPNKTCLGLEYFCFEGDGLWSMSDGELITLGKQELQTLGLIETSEVEEGKVVRVSKAYPVYDSTYKESLETLRRFFDTFSNFQLVGRNGMHKYNNQDHSMMTAALAVKNILGAKHDLWQINTDQEYLEDGDRKERETTEQLVIALSATQPAIPERTQPPRAVPAVD